MEDGVYLVTPEQITERSGVPLHRVLTLYPTLNDVAADIRSIVEEAARPLYERMPEAGPLPDMLDGLVDLRAELYETVAVARLAADVVEHMLESVTRQKARREGRYRGRLASMLVPYFGASTPQVTDHVEWLTSWESWRHLRQVQCLSSEQASDCIKLQLHAAVAFFPQK